MKTSLCAVLFSMSIILTCSRQEPGIVTIQLTDGPGHYWFGYYDKLQIDPQGRYVLSNKVLFEGRSPKADDSIEVGMIDLLDNNKWIKLGESRAWNWQQGCMLQWRPGSAHQVVWNDRID